MNSGVCMQFVSAMEKIFPEGDTGRPIERISALKNERLNFQLVVVSPFERKGECKWTVKGSLAPYAEVRVVDYAKGYYNIRPDSDDYVIFRDGRVTLYPEILRTPDYTDLCLYPNVYRTLWITLFSPGGLPPGEHELSVCLKDWKGNFLAEKSITVCVVDVELEKSDLVVTNWMHYDCIAGYYGEQVFSEGFYRILGKFFDSAFSHGINTVYTPLFTPPLDTERGGERRTVQTVGIRAENGKYEFDFSGLEKFIRFAESHGAEYFELSHLATQWGAEFCPKIVAERGGREEKIFGWHTPSAGAEYRSFLAAFLPALVDRLKAWGIKDKCFLHISDEPSEEHLTDYLALKRWVETFSDGIPVIDALSDYGFYLKKAVDLPVVDIYNTEPFRENNAKHWVYYCCSNHKQYVSNRFFNMPSQRNRILGMQMYLNGASGFLHWGFNFYNSYLSKEEINPFMTTDAGGFFQSGDSFVVYPARDGVWDSLRLEVFSDGLEDYRALKTLERQRGRAFTESLLRDEGMAGYKIYRRDANRHFDFREKINALISETAPYLPHEENMR